MKLLFNDYNEKTFIKTDFVLLTNGCLVYKDDKGKNEVKLIKNLKYIIVDNFFLHDDRNLIERILKII
ncbi:MAG: hypothetical protein ACRC7S_09220 [Cetobacterium sp.]